MMLRRLEVDSTPWRSGPFHVRPSQVIFGQTYEDCAIELHAFKPQSRVFSIAGAGCTARALARAGHRVTAVDIDPLQLYYAESRAAGKPWQMGAVEDLLALGRRMARFAGWSRERLTEFLNFSDCAEQVDYWDSRLETYTLRSALDTLLSPLLLRFCYAGPFVESLPGSFGRQIRRRLRRGWAMHSNRTNPYAASLLLGTPPVDPGPPAYPIEFVCADAADFLEGSPPSSYDAFALSNIGDGTSPEFVHRLWRAVEHAAAPDAVVVLRTFAEPGPDTAANWASMDRSMLWGVVGVHHVGISGKGGKPCFIG
jgi:S-adenosylmethionine:diacylglycerol 3-amino-3-carboxypropyl transferase